MRPPEHAEPTSTAAVKAPSQKASNRQQPAHDTVPTACRGPAAPTGRQSNCCIVLLPPHTNTHRYQHTAGYAVGASLPCAGLESTCSIEHRRVRGGGALPADLVRACGHQNMLNQQALLLSKRQVRRQATESNQRPHARMGTLQPDKDRPSRQTHTSHGTSTRPGSLLAPHSPVLAWKVHADRSIEHRRVHAGGAMGTLQPQPWTTPAHDTAAHTCTCVHTAATRQEKRNSTTKREVPPSNGPYCLQGPCCPHRPAE
jgi:hypothetical protein